MISARILLFAAVLLATLATVVQAQSPSAQAVEGKPVAAASGHATAQRPSLIVSVTIFVLAIFLGVEIIRQVPATLHTPLMSGSNAISGITVVGAIIAAGASGRAGPRSDDRCPPAG